MVKGDKEAQAAAKEAAFEDAIPDGTKRGNNWARGALKRGFFAAAQAYDAANLSIIKLLPGVTKAIGFQSVFGTEEKIVNRIARWEQKIEENDIEPIKPGYLKSGASFLLYNAAYLTPIMAIGMAAGMTSGIYAALITAGLVNTHATMGEAFVQTARRKAPDGINEAKKLEDLLANDKFRRQANVHVGIMGAVCLGITLAAGPLARLLGGFTSGALSSIARTPLGAYMTEPLVSAAHKNVVKSARKPLGKVFSAVANQGPAMIAAQTAAFVSFTRATTSSIMGIFKKASEQDNEPQADITANDNNVDAEAPDVIEPQDIDKPAPPSVM